MNTPVLAVEGMTVKTRMSGAQGSPRPVILHDVSFLLTDGEILGLVGVSGSEKPTLLKAVVRRPALPRGRGLALTGNLEILFPLLTYYLLDLQAQQDREE